MKIAEMIRVLVMELCEEDDYGSWELWCSSKAEFPGHSTEEIQREFLDVIQNLIKEGKIVSKKHLPDGECVPTPFNAGRLKREMEDAKRPDRDKFYWFGTP